MAVVDTYVTPTAIAGSNFQTSICDALYSGGKKVRVILAQFTTGAGDSATSTYRLFRSMKTNVVPLQIWLANAASAGNTAFSLGLYKIGIGGVAILASVFRAVIDLSVARASLNPAVALDCMSSVAAANYGFRLFEHAGHTEITKLAAYDIVLTANTTAGVAGLVQVLMLYTDE